MQQENEVWQPGETSGAVSEEEKGQESTASIKSAASIASLLEISV